MNAITAQVKLAIDRSSIVPELGFAFQSAAARSSSAVRESVRRESIALLAELMEWRVKSDISTCGFRSDETQQSDGCQP